MMFPYHPAANIMPAMSPEEFAELVDSVSKNGLLEKIELFDGQVLDGRSRQEACKNLNLAHSDMYIQRSVHDFPNGCPFQYVWEKHLRRNLTPSQRGIVAAKMKDAAGVVNIHQSRRDRAKSAGVDKNTVQAAEEVIANGAKEVVELVEQGKLAVSQAKKLVEAVPDKKEQAKVVGAGKEEVKRRISGGVTFDVAEIEGAEAEPGRKPKNGAPSDSDSLEAVQKDLKDFEAKLRELARLGRTILGAKGNEINRPWCGRYSLLTLIQPIQHVARTVANDMPVGGSPDDPKLHREAVAESA